MSNQLQVDAPPIDDDNYIPTNKEELAIALSSHVKNEEQIDSNLKLQKNFCGGLVKHTGSLGYTR